MKLGFTAPLFSAFVNRHEIPVDETHGHGIGRRELGTLVHSHVQRRILIPEAEPPLRRIKLMRAYTQISQYSVK